MTMRKIPEEKKSIILKILAQIITKLKEMDGHTISSLLSIKE